MLRKYAEAFYSYMKNVSMDYKDHTNSIKGDGVINNRFLPNPSVVIHGSEIFNIFEEGTTINHQNEKKEMETKDIMTDWH